MTERKSGDEILRWARDYLAGRKELIETSRAITALADPALPASDAFDTFAAIASETGDLPIGEVRAQWQADALAKADREIKRAGALNAHVARKACRRLIAELSPVRFPFADAVHRLDEAPDDFITLMTADEARLLLFAPRRVDNQTPHAQDEVYIVVSGSGTFRRGDEVVPFTAGDMLFVAAQVPHRFESFSDDFKTWVVFFGPRTSSAY